jgi:hypothetical protein
VDYGPQASQATGIISLLARARPLQASLAALFAYLAATSAASGEEPVYTLLYTLLAIEYLAYVLRRR